MHDGTTITVIIDDGIAIANERFRDAEGRSRILYFLDMNSENSCPSSENLGPTLSTDGSTWSKEQLNKIFDKFCDEEEVYRYMGLIDPRLIDRRKDDGLNPLARHRQPLRYHQTHGTHVADLAAGFDPRTALPEELNGKIIAIQLPDAIVADRSDSHMSIALRRALIWLGDRLLSLQSGDTDEGKPVPFVVNFSFGAHTASGEGESSIDHVIGDFIADHQSHPCHFVLAAGNGLQARSRAVVALDPGVSRSLDWQVQPDDLTSSFIQILTPRCKEDVQQIRVDIRPPRRGPENEEASKRGYMLDWIEDGQTLARIYHQQIDRHEGKARERVTIAIRPTAVEDLEEPVCPHGCWTLSITNLTGGTLICDLRVQRDDPVPGVRRAGRQSYFLHDDYVIFEEPSGRLRNDETKESGPIRRQGTLSSYVTAPGAISVGGYVYADGEPARYSASGVEDTSEPQRAGPSYATVSETSPAHPGILAAATRSGGIALMDGTSVAAPQLTRKLVRGGALTEQTSGPHGEYKEGRETRIGSGRLTFDELRPKAKRIQP